MILGEESITLRRFAAGSRGSDGRWTDGVVTTSTILGSFQPASYADLQTLPEGERQRDARKVYTITELRVASPSAGTKADEIVAAGVTYEVRSVAYERKIIPHYKGLLLRIQETDA